MAGFAVDIGDEGSSFAAPVNMPSGGGMTAAAEGLAALGKGVFGMLDEAAKANRQTEGSINRAHFTEAARSLDALAGADPLAVRVGVQAVYNKYVNSDIPTKALSDLIMVKTGVDLSYLNLDPNQEALNAVNKTLKETPGLMVLAQRELESTGKPYTPDDVYRVAAVKAQSIVQDTAYLASVNKASDKEFESRVKPTVTSITQKLLPMGLAALAAETVAGQDVRPESYLRLYAEIEKARAISSAGLTGEKKTWVDNQFDILKSLVDTARDYDKGVLDQKRADVLEPITGALIRQAAEAGQTDPLLARAILDPKLDLSAYISNKYGDFTKALAKVESGNLTYVDLDFSAFEPAMDQAAQAAKTDPNADPIPNGPDIHAPAELEKAMGFSDIQRRDAFTAATALVNLASVKNMSAPQQRDLFFNGIAQATANLSTSGELFRAGSINSLLNDEVFAKLKEAEKYDPDGARLAKDRLGDALKAQANAALTALSGSTQTSSFKIAGIGKVEIDLAKVGQAGTVFAGVSRDTMALAQGLASKWYDGNVSAMIEDRGRRLNTFDRSQLEAGGWKTNQYAQELIKVKKQTETLRLYSDHMKRLGFPTKFFDEMIIKGVQKASEGGDGLQRGTLKNPWQIMWSDSTDADEKMFAGLDVGDYFINRDGDIEQKVK